MFTMRILLLLSAVLAPVVHGASGAKDEEEPPTPPMTMKEVARDMEDSPPVTETVPVVRVQLGRFDSKDGVSFRFDEATGSVVVETPFNLRGGRHVASHQAPMTVTPINSTVIQESLRKGEWTDNGDDTTKNVDSRGYAPDHLPIRPAHPDADHSKNVRAVFGKDDRVVFQDTSYPYSTVGRTSNGCTGTMIGRRHVLTAAHCISSSTMTFTPSYYNGAAPFGVASVTNIIHWDIVNTDDGFTDDEVAFDYAVLILDTNIGDLTGWVGSRTYSSSWNNGAFWDNIGYPSELTGNQRPAFTSDGAIRSTETYTSGGNSGLVLGHFIDIEPGNSGGPFWGWWGGETFPSIIAVQSSQSFNPAFTSDGDNQAAGGPALTDLITYARNNYN